MYLAMIGGFSFGDHIAEWKTVFANIYKFKLGEEI